MSDLASSSSASSALDTLIVWMFRAGSVGVGLVALTAGLLYYHQERLLYFPSMQGIPRSNAENPDGYRSPQDRQLVYHDLRIPTPDGLSIHAWLVFHPSISHRSVSASSLPKDGLPTILYFHGNAGNVGFRLPNLVYMMQQLPPCNVVMVEYRGYGDSDDATPTEAGLKQDAVAAYEYLVAKAPTLLAPSGTTPAINLQQLYAFGRSLGGAVAFYLAHYAQEQHAQQPHHKPALAGMIVENTFTSISDMVDVIFPLLTPLKPWVLTIGWDSATYAPLLATPILYLAGAMDTLVPHAQMQQLYKLSNANKRQFPNKVVEMHVIPNGTHNESWYQGGQPYWQAMTQFLQQTSRLAVQVAAATAQMDAAVPQQESIPTMRRGILDIAKDALSQQPAQSSTDSKDKRS